MLILTRRVGESLVIGDRVNAPKEVTVHREEIYQRIKLEQQQGKQPPSPQSSEGSPVPTADFPNK